MPTMTETRPMVASAVADFHAVSLAETPALSDEIDATVRRIMMEVPVAASRFQSAILENGLAWTRP